MLAFDRRQRLCRLHKVCEVPFKTILPKGETENVSIFTSIFQPLVEDELQIYLLEGLNGVTDDVRLQAVSPHVPLNACFHIIELWSAVPHNDGLGCRKS